MESQRVPFFSIISVKNDLQLRFDVVLNKLINIEERLRLNL